MKRKDRFEIIEININNEIIIIIMQTYDARRFQDNCVNL